ncbi:DNA-binding protein [Bifidobacterium criceti]|uniref:DNA-binding protein n=2 Tax=Bifidobacterium criceti TaxID=1960969 RepID=A0A2A2EDF2_9BIFI|nr:DNA-binding protein [Bifidobacterium criceti]
MTLGDKIRAARLEAGLTQDEMAGKLFVSRQAITKWENGKGVPDIGNLRRLARLLGVSVDYLLDDGEDAEAATRALREPIDLTSVDARRSADSGWSIKAAKKDVIVRGMWPDATIHRLVSEPILTHDEKVVDNVLGFLTPAGFGIPQILDSVRDRRDRYYLVDRGTFQLLVTVSDEFVESRRLAEHVDLRRGAHFAVGAVRLTVAAPLARA